MEKATAVDVELVMMEISLAECRLTMPLLPKEPCRLADYITDDITRDAIRDVFKDSVVLDEKLVEQILIMYRQHQRESEQIRAFAGQIVSRGFINFF